MNIFVLGWGRGRRGWGVDVRERERGCVICDVLEV